MRYRIVIELDTTRAIMDQIVAALRSNARQRVGAGNWVHIVLESPGETSEQIGSEIL